MSTIPQIQPKLTDKDVIKLFVDRLAQNGYPGLTVDTWLDENNRQTSDIDAIVEPFDIEHTSVDTVPNHRRDSDWFLKVVKELDEWPDRDTIRFMPVLGLTN